MSDEIKTTGIGSYAPPLDKLLTYGTPTFGDAKEWPDYRKLGLNSEHVSELVRMVGDQELNESLAETEEIWGPTHAWRALGQLNADAAVEPLLVMLPKLINDDDWALQELPQVLGMLGPATVPKLAAFLFDKAQDESARVSVSDALGYLAEYYPDQRAEVIKTFSEQLEKSRLGKSDEMVNAFVINNLVKLNAVESAPLIEQIYSSKNIDESIIGDWEDTQVRLGLLEARLTPPPRYNIGPELNLPTRRESLDAPDSAPIKTQAQRKAVKAKRKIEKASRKKNRKRK